MIRLLDDICGFLKQNGFRHSVLMRHGLDAICVTVPGCSNDRVILPLEISSSSPQQAAGMARMVEDCIEMIRSCDGGYPLIITRDRWERQRDMMEKRLLAHLQIFMPMYARNCEVRKIDKTLAREFLEKNHSYGYAACRYCYGLFFKRHTGHIAEAMGVGGSNGLMAVATFSNARKWVKGERVIRSYEWTRYASLPEVRLSGGMGRLLKAFIKEVEPDDIMSYADLEWSEGEVYRRLGFELEGTKEPVMFSFDGEWRRFPVKPGRTEEKGQRFFRNFGSNKYRLKLTDYQ